MCRRNSHAAARRGLGPPRSASASLLAMRSVPRFFVRVIASGSRPHAAVKLAREVVVPREAIAGEQGDRHRCPRRFGAPELDGLSDSQPVSQAVGAWVHVRVGWQRG